MGHNASKLTETIPFLHNHTIIIHSDLPIVINLPTFEQGIGHSNQFPFDPLFFELFNGRN